MIGSRQKEQQTVPKRQRVLAIHRYYWPDSPPYAVMLRKIIARWCDDGHRVDVLSSQPSYKSALENERRPTREQIDRADVYRLTLPSESGRPIIRIVNALRLCLAIIWKAVLVRRYDVIMISTAPPVLGGVAAAFVARLTGARFIYHCMDIYPEIGRISGEFSNPLIFKTLMMLDSWSCRVANPVVVLSEDMADALRVRSNGSHLKIEVINNFGLPSDSTSPVTIPFNLSGEKFKILFAGNIGRFQGLDMVLVAMGKLKERDDIEFLFMGEGTMKNLLQKKAEKGGLNIRFLDHQSVDIAKAVMGRVQVGFVSLVPDLYRYAYPSKTMTYLEQGCPLLVAVETQSELARDVRERKLGCTIPTGDVEGLAKVICEMADNHEKLVNYSKSAMRHARNNYSESAVLPRWSRLLEQIESYSNGKK